MPQDNDSSISLVGRAGALYVFVLGLSNSVLWEKRLGLLLISNRLSGSRPSRQDGKC